MSAVQHAPLKRSGIRSADGEQRLDQVSSMALIGVLSVLSWAGLIAIVAGLRSLF
jgi:hypothetical protein